MINIKYPIYDDNNTNRFFRLNQISKDAMLSNLLLLLFTGKGERYYDPDYGTYLMVYIFEPNDSITQDAVIKDIKKTVSIYMPAIKISTVEFSETEDDKTQLNVHIEFTYSEENFTESGELDLNF